MTRLLPVAAVALFGLTAPVVSRADDKPKKDEVPLKGTWEKAGDFAISFTFDTKTEGKCEVRAGGAGLKMTLKYEYADDTVKAEVTAVKEDGDFPAKVPVGFKMKFKVKKLDADTVKISDYDGDNHEEAKAVVEGEYKKKKGD